MKQTSKYRTIERTRRDNLKKTKINKTIKKYQRKETITNEDINNDRENERHN